MDQNRGKYGNSNNGSSNYGNRQNGSNNGQGYRQRHHGPSRTQKGEVICYKCGGINHIARDCKGNG